MRAAFGKVLGQVGQVQRQARAHHQRVDAAGQRVVRIGLVFADGTHDVHRDQAAAAGDLARLGDFARHAHEVRGVDLRLGLGPHEMARLLHQVRVMPAQVHRGDRAHRAEPGDGAGQAAGGDADAHAALYDGQQRFAAQFQKIQPRSERDGPQGRRHFGRVDVGCIARIMK